MCGWRVICDAVDSSSTFVSAVTSYSVSSILSAYEYLLHNIPRRCPTSITGEYWKLDNK